MIDRLVAFNPWLLYPAMVALVLVGAWIGRRLGVRARRRDADNADHLPAAQSVLIGLLSLMVGFTLNVSLARWQARQTAVLHETNAIETALAPRHPPARRRRGARQVLLIDYLHVRIAFGAPGGRPRQRMALVEHSDQLQANFGVKPRHATGDGRQPLAVSNFVTALDGIGEAHQERLAADYTEIPATVTVTLYGLAIVAFGYLGFVGAARAPRTRCPTPYWRWPSSRSSPWWTISIDRMPTDQRQSTLSGRS